MDVCTIAASIGSAVVIPTVRALWIRVQSAEAAKAEAEQKVIALYQERAALAEARTAMVEALLEKAISRPETS